MTSRRFGSPHHRLCTTGWLDWSTLKRHLQVEEALSFRQEAAISTWEPRPKSPSTACGARRSNRKVWASARGLSMPVGLPKSAVPLPPTTMSGTRSRPRSSLRTPSQNCVQKQLMRCTQPLLTILVSNLALLMCSLGLRNFLRGLGNKFLIWCKDPMEICGQSLSS